jgi:hypothetical protein
LNDGKGSGIVFGFFGHVLDGLIGWPERVASYLGWLAPPAWSAMAV